MFPQRNKKCYHKNYPQTHSIWSSDQNLQFFFSVFFLSRFVVTTEITALERSPTLTVQVFPNLTSGDPEPLL